MKQIYGYYRLGQSYARRKLREAYPIRQRPINTNDFIATPTFIIKANLSSDIDNLVTFVDGTSIPSKTFNFASHFPSSRRKLNERPDNFTINRQHPLYGSLGLAYLGGISKGILYRDYSANHTDGIIIGSPSVSREINRMVLTLNGTTQYINTNSIFKTFFTKVFNRGFWASVWVKAPYQSASMSIFGGVNLTGPSYGLVLQIHTSTYGTTQSGSVRSLFVASAGNSYEIVPSIPSMSLNDGYWHNIIFIITPRLSNGRIYVDGIPLLTYVTGAADMSPFVCQYPLYLGARDGNNTPTAVTMFKGKISDFMMGYGPCPLSMVKTLSDPSNFMYDMGGKSLILPPVRNTFPVAGAQTITGRNNPISLNIDNLASAGSNITANEALNIDWSSNVVNVSANESFDIEWKSNITPYLQGVIETKRQTIANLVKNLDYTKNIIPNLSETINNIKNIKPNLSETIEYAGNINIKSDESFNIDWSNKVSSSLSTSAEYIKGLGNLTNFQTSINSTKNISILFGEPIDNRGFIVVLSNLNFPFDIRTLALPPPIFTGIPINGVYYIVARNVIWGVKSPNLWGLDNYKYDNIIWKIQNSNTFYENTWAFDKTNTTVWKLS